MIYGLMIPFQRGGVNGRAAKNVVLQDEKTGYKISKNDKSAVRDGLVPENTGYIRSKDYGFAAA